MLCRISSNTVAKNKECIVISWTPEDCVVCVEHRSSSRSRKRPSGSTFRSTGTREPSSRATQMTLVALQVWTRSTTGTTPHQQAKTCLTNQHCRKSCRCGMLCWGSSSCQISFRHTCWHDLHLDSSTGAVVQDLDTEAALQQWLCGVG